LTESFNNIEIIKANSTEHIESDKFKRHNFNFFKYNMKAVKTNELTSPLMEIIGSFAFAAVIVVGGAKVISGELTTGTFTSFIAALFMLYTPIKRLSSLYNTWSDVITPLIGESGVACLPIQLQEIGDVYKKGYINKF
ncbi:MAG: hypothetical protein JKX98_06465, partial [Alcanivoracaceae bacterium]|nr:hypothetical protein [Alcanivoracaceae bacterium]